MSQAFSTDYATMKQAEAMFKSTHSQMVQALDDLEADVEARLAVWEDDSRDAYFEAKAKWDKAAREMADLVKEFGEGIGTAQQNYQSAEQSNTSLWG